MVGSMKTKKDIESLIEYNNSYPNGVPYISIVIATFNKASLLDKTLTSIIANETDIPYEIIIVDDGSTDHTLEVCKKYDVTYIWLNGKGYRNPAVPRNIGCRAARGQVLIMQSDDVLHESTDTIANLADVQRDEAHFACVWNVDATMNKVGISNYKDSSKRTNIVAVCHPIEEPATHFFLGSMYKDDFWSIGGNDEDFTSPGYEDKYLGELIKRKYKICWRMDVVGLHQDHKRPANVAGLIHSSHQLYLKKMKELE